jgi:hypothetical protein
MFTSTALVFALLAPSLAPTERHAITVDEEKGTLEILAFDGEGEMVGALLAQPSVDRIRIDASFPDGHASFELVLDPTLPPQPLDTDLEPNVAVRRVSDLLAFILTAGPIEGASRRECMWIFAGLAGSCGLAATFTPTGVAGVLAAWGCLSGLGAAACSCAEHLPELLRIC